ncbi:MAG TPA: ARMT1-like domain-containing protein [Deltaproteobacteria bacterium]|nr:ARMT1-like domain-containing protein [Deltaproteobacteria bacterium]HOI07583.1 ARMT1-like domain-containing protein [Deltaproteobacteria bacterium]
MQTRPDCIPCLVRHARELARDNLPEHDREPFFEAVMERLAAFDLENPPPLFARVMYDVLQGMSGTADPFARRKVESNRRALELVPRLEKMISDAPDPLDASLRMATAGNIIDFGIHDATCLRIEDTVHRALTTPFAIDSTPELGKRLREARSVLYIADNAGEIVLDMLFIRRIGPEKVTCAVRSAPIINDATLADARQAGLTELCRVVSSGSNVSGTPLGICTDGFRELFFSADVVISKGQGNFETLAWCGREVFYLLMVKCPVISAEVGVPLGSFVAPKRG